MTPPPLPSSSPKKKSGCLKIALWLVIAPIAFFTLFGLFVTPKIQRSNAEEFKKNKESILEEISRAGQQGDEGTVSSLETKYRAVEDESLTSALSDARAAISKSKQEETKWKNVKPADSPPASAEPPKVQQTPEQMVERIVKEETADRFTSASSQWDEGSKGWLIHYRAKMPEAFDKFHTDGVRREMIKIAARCHTPGMKVSRFVAIYDTELTDGLGNVETGKVLQCEMIPGIASKINWGDKSGDLYNLSFDRIFQVKTMHPTVRAQWEK